MKSLKWKDLTSGQKLTAVRVSNLPEWATQILWDNKETDGLVDFTASLKHETVRYYGSDLEYPKVTYRNGIKTVLNLETGRKAGEIIGNKEEGYIVVTFFGPDGSPTFKLKVTKDGEIIARVAA